MEDRGLKMEGEGAPTLRLFVAIPLPDEIKKEIAKAQQELRWAVGDKAIRWTKQERFHFTIKFLGNVDSARVAELTESLRNACIGFTALHLRVLGIGFFPNKRHPRVIWGAVTDEDGILPRLQHAIEVAVNKFTNEKSEGKFAGHVTLGRVGELRPRELEALLKVAVASLLVGEWVADGVELIRSELSSTGSRYTTLAAIPFASQK